MNWHLLSKLAARPQPSKKPGKRVTDVLPSRPKADKPMDMSYWQSLDLEDPDMPDYLRETAHSVLGIPMPPRRKEEAPVVSDGMRDQARVAKFGPIASTPNYVSVSGLYKPQGAPEGLPPLLWKNLDGSTPDLIRFMFNPKSGATYVGTQQFHAYQLGKRREHGQFDEFVRGFYIPKRKTIALRPFSNPDGKYDTFDRAARVLSDTVHRSMTAMFQRELDPYVKGLKIDTGPEGGLGNEYLKKQYGDLSERW